MSVKSNSEREFTVSTILETAYAAFESAEVRDVIGLPEADRLANLVSRAAIITINENGVAELPEGVNIDEAVPVLPLHGGEEVLLGRTLRRQTAIQRQAAIATIEHWAPDKTTDSAEIFVDKIVENITRNDNYRFSFSADKGGYVTSAIAMFAVDTSKFANVPKGFAQLATVPILGLSLDHEIKPESAGHELVHWRQWQETPILNFDSQQAIDMALLRMELEGYHYGAGVHVAMAGNKQPYIPYSIAKIYEAGLVQVAIEKVRVRHNTDPDDPFRPSPQLLRAIKRVVGQSIIHHEIDYQATVDKMNTYSMFEIHG